jgi:peptide/nickel transport system substrate-binding protein
MVSNDETTRRALLRGAASLPLAATAGCTADVRNVVGRDQSERVSLRIKTLPTDADPFAIHVARRLARALESVGVAVELLPMEKEEFYRHLLINHDFDLYVAPFGGDRDPDVLRPLFHSRYASERGWQNPFGYSDLEVDDLLDRQRRTIGAERRSAAFEVQTLLAEAQPCTVVAFPDAILAVRDDRFTGWRRVPPSHSLGYLTVDTMDDTETTLRASLRDKRPTRNLNPIAVEHRDQGLITGLIYDSLGRRYGRTVDPWLADRWRWDEGGDGLRATVDLRETRWHDGERVTAADVGFTYDLLADTSLGRAEAPIPAERFRGRASLVEEASPVGDRTVRFDFGETAREVARRAFAVPILPRHVWTERTEAATVAGVSVDDGTTTALVSDNLPPVGSGPLRVVDVETDRRIVLEATGDHFLGAVGGRLGAAVGDALAYDRLVFRPVPSDSVAVETVAADEADVVASTLGPEVVPEVGYADAVDLIVRPSSTFYHVGYNTRRAPLSNPRFRRAVARLLDKAAIVDDVFDGYAAPAASPLAAGDWLAPDLTWEREAPVLPFAGENGRLDVERAKEPFVDAGYSYHDGALHSR